MERSMIRLAVSILGLVFLVQCTSNEEIEFLQGKSLLGTPVNEITVLSRGNVYLNVADTFLVVITSSHEPFLRIYSTNSHQLLKEFGREGRGPGEFLDVTPLRQTGFDTSNESPILYVHDFRRNIIAGINLKKLIEGEDVISMEVLPIDRSYLNFVHYWDEDYLVASPSTGGNLYIHDYKTNQSEVVPYLPELEFTLAQPDTRLPMIYRAAVVVNRDKGLIAVAPMLLGELDFFDFDGNLLRSSIFEARDTYKDELTSNRPLNDIKYQILDLDVKNDMIYGLNYNVAGRDYNSEEWNSKIQVFDWNGNPVIEYPLDGRPLRYFAVDEVNNRIYAYDPNEQEYNIVVYELE